MNMMMDWELTDTAMENTAKRHLHPSHQEDSHDLPVHSDVAPIFIEGPDKPLPCQLPGHIRCFILSDTHGRHSSCLSKKPLPQGDVLLHLGDVADRGNLDHIRSFAEFMKHQPFCYKIVLEGNHDRDLQHPDRIDLQREYRGTGIHLLRDDVYTCHNAAKRGTLTFYGASWDSCEREDFEKAKDQDFDVLLTHSPVSRSIFAPGGVLANHPQQQQQQPIRLCLYGHVHGMRGIRRPNNSRNGRNDGTQQDNAPRNITMVNCCTSSRSNQPVVVDWDPAAKRLHMVHCP